ncbi:sugar ABC transporter substrate-binding protein [Acrocarpospora phusangensis]|uniref:Sugar ABC transporter substrate-binding protein n=1 Tax=Acrocarpospora phusangensis TaxID=1070424 RepID=A0A919QDG1_9ACTN|nr:ABC transporter substrate-binding protein [Acrocarpospora phusangensis]GIH27194.1 sugar ABC transporter substrate-binding protein [Acrocarpospora phusangensis]
MIRTVTAALLAGAVAGCGSTEDGITRINLYNAPQQNIQLIADRCNRLAAGRYRIIVNVLPRDANGQREQLVRRLAAGDPGLDVLGLDVTWTAELAEAGWIREWTGSHAERARAGTLAKPLDTAVWRGRLYAAPYNTNVQLLWYRADLVERAPVTWQGIMEAAERLAAAGKPAYGEVPGAQYEGLAVWLNSMVAAAGGSILTPDGNAVALGPPALRALGVMRAYARSKAADPSLSNTHEDEARLAVEAGRAAFEVNWPYVYASMAANRPDLLPHFRWSAYPGIDGPGRPPLGGANFAISRYSEHPREAFEAALCLRDPESQRLAAIKDGLPPTIEAVYADPELAQVYPMRQAILDALETAAPRPKTPVYQNVSTVIAAVLSPPAEIDPPVTLAALRRQISDALQSKGVLP